MFYKCSKINIIDVWYMIFWKVKNNTQFKIHWKFVCFNTFHMNKYLSVRLTIKTMISDSHNSNASFFFIHNKTIIEY